MNAPPKLPEKLFHVTSLLLDIGSVILPGNWARGLDEYTLENIAGYLLFRENLFEKIRAKIFPQKPSRWKGIFACPTRVIAEQFRLHHRPEGVLYEVKTTLPEAPWHIGEWHYFANPPSKTRLGDPKMREWAIKYWQDDEKHNPEFLTLSPLEIISPPLDRIEVPLIPAQPQY